MQADDAPENDAVATLARLVTKDLLPEIGGWPAAEKFTYMQALFRHAPAFAFCAALVVPVETDRQERDNYEIAKNKLPVDTARQLVKSDQGQAAANQNREMALHDLQVGENTAQLCSWIIVVLLDGELKRGFQNGLSFGILLVL